MKISKSAITQLASEGRLTLQAPQFHIGSPPNDLTEYDDDLFIQLKGGEDICYGKQTGYLYLSEKGYNFFKQDLMQAFKNIRGYTWKDFEDHAKNHFDKVKNKQKKRIAKLQKDLQELQSIIP